MLEKLSLRNFQTHVRFDVELSPSINVFVGESDAGKSSILRALKWVCTGQAPRSPITTWGKDETKVRLKVDGRIVSRTKGKKRNIYKLDGKKFAAVGQGNVPSEIAALLNVGEQNFAGQHASHYFLADTPGEVARQLNSIVNLGLIDASLAEAARQVGQAKGEREAVRGRLEQAEARAEELKWTEDANRDLTGLEQLYSKLEQLCQDRVGIAEAIKDGKRAEEAAGAAQQGSQAKQSALQRLEGVAKYHASLVDHRNAIQAILDDMSCKASQEREQRAKAAGLEATMGTVCPTCLRPMPGR